MTLIQTELRLSNFVPELSRVLANAVSPNSISREVTRQSKSLSQVILSRLKGAAPDGTKWTEPDYETRKGNRVSHGRPSIRQHNITLEAGWEEPSVSSIADGAKISFYTNAPHLKYLTSGSKGTFITPTNKKALSFYSFTLGLPVLAGGVDHKGFEANPFVERTVAKSESLIYTSLEEAIVSAMRPLGALLSK